MVMARLAKPGHLADIPDRQVRANNRHHGNSRGAAARGFSVGVAFMLISLLRMIGLITSPFARHRRDKFRLQEPPTPLTSERHCLYVLNPQFVLPPLYWAHHLP